MKDSINQVSDTVYRVQATEDKFKLEHPDETIVIATATKARRTADEKTVSAGLGWATARRGSLILTERAFYCGNWEIPLDKLKYAEYVVIPTISGIKSIVIKIADNDGNHYQFGVSNMDKWFQQDIVKFKKGELVSWYPYYIWGVRIFVISLLIYYLYLLIAPLI